MCPDSSVAIKRIRDPPPDRRRGLLTTACGTGEIFACFSLSIHVMSLTGQLIYSLDIKWPSRCEYIWDDKARIGEPRLAHLRLMLCKPLRLFSYDTQQYLRPPAPITLGRAQAYLRHGTRQSHAVVAPQGP